MQLAFESSGMSELNEILERYWNYKEFRPMQEDIVSSVLQGRDTMAILPTGGGKSICFQVPALARTGICLVISPLIALMKDQVENLKKRNIPALLIHTGMKRIDVKKILQNATNDYFKFLYLSPERLETSLFKEYLPAMDISMVAIDEAHCISQWGYDFRPAYLRIAALREELPGVPFLALTASATPLVQQDICEKLHLQSPQIFRQSFERKNLSYSAFEVPAKLPRLVEILTKVQGTAIVYCKSRRRTTELKKLLQMHGISTDNYHAGLLQEERNSKQKDWINNTTRVIACTNAFGMGIDKPDVRTVIHVDLPDCLENYYQEAGRAGRDGLRSYAVLLYDQKDLQELEELYAIRFPDEDTIRQVYSALVNFLQLPVNSGEYRSFDFSITEFSKAFKLDVTTALYSLKALEQEGWLEFKEKDFSPATVLVTASKRSLEEFYKAHPAQEEMVVSLLRAYGGIFDYPVFISEMMLARQVKLDEKEVKLRLQTLASHGIVSYSPQNESPTITFLKNRVAVEDFRFRSASYARRKELFIKRAATMIGFASTTQCRSEYINQYFGDSDARACGICDNCLAKKGGDISKEEFEKIAFEIRQSISAQPLSATDLILQLKAIRKEKVWKVLGFLQDEGKVRVEDQKLRWRS